MVVTFFYKEGIYYYATSQRRILKALTKGAQVAGDGFVGMRKRMENLFNCAC